MTTTQDARSQAAMTPEGVLALLQEGNERFRASRREDRDLMEQVRATRSGQWPYAVVLACIDSRAAPELIFDLGIGDVFTTRLAGNVVDEDVLGSMEFACKVAGACVVLVLGHTHCGAVKGACDHVEMGNLTALLSKLQPAVSAVAEPSDAGQRNSQNADFVQAVARKNVQMTLETLRDRSPILAELEGDGKIAIVGGMYDIESGAVDFIG